MFVNKLLGGTQMCKVYIFDEFQERDLRDEIDLAETVEDLKKVLHSLLDCLPVEYVE